MPEKTPDAAHGMAARLTRFFPGVLLLRGYRREWLLGDLLSGISGGVVVIPSAIAYAALLGIPPQYGLYASLVPLLIYPIFGSSREMLDGPDIAISLLIASAITPLAGGNPAHAAALAGMIAVLSGLLLVIGARTKMGAVADFFSKPVLVGYMTGAALILMASQLNKLFGVSLKSNEFFTRLMELGRELPQTHWPTLIFGVCLLAMLFVLRRISRKIPAALVVCVIAMIASRVLHLEERGVAVVGEFPRGLPAFVAPSFEWREILALFPAIIGISLLTYTEGILLARSFAAKNGYEINANQELTALGAADIVTGFFQGFAGTGSQSRTAINDATGAKSQLAGLVAAVTLGFFLMFLTPLMARLPLVALGAVLIYGGFTLVEFGVMKRIYRYYPRSAMVAALTTLAVVAAGVIPGILVGVVLSLLGLIKRISHPPDAVLREVPGHGFHDLGDAAIGQTIPGLLAYRFYAPLLFSNASYFLERVRKLIAESPSPVVWFLLDAQAITDIDVTAAETLHSLHLELLEKGITMKIAHANRPFRGILERTGLASEIKEDSFYPSVHECVDAFKNQTSRPTP
jgi:SulP family sulfate permease